MDSGGVSSADNEDEVARLEALVERRHELWEELGDCEDDEARNRVFDDLAANREERTRLEEIISLNSDEPGATSQPAGETPEPPGSVGETLRANLLLPAEEEAPASSPEAPPSLAEAPPDADDWQPLSQEAPSDSVAPEPAEPKRDPDPVAPGAETTRPIDPKTPPSAPESTPDGSREDDPVSSRSSRQSEAVLSAEAGPESEAPVDLDEQRRSAHERYEDLERVRPDRGRSVPIGAIQVAIGALAVVALFLFLRPSGPAETIETGTTSTIATETPVVDQIRSVLAGLGYGSILVEERAGTVYLAGVVDSDGDHNAAVSATRGVTGDMPLDSSGLTTLAEDGPTDPPAPSETDGEDQQPVVAPTVVTGPYVEATLDGKDFVLAGAVPSAELASNYLRAAEIAYSPYVRSELMVDEQLEPVEWLSRGPDAIVLLPMLIDGSILIANGQVQMSVRSPDEAGVERLQGALGQITGLPVVLGDVEILNLQPPSYVIAADAGVVRLGGQVPTEEIRDLLVEGAAAAYGTGNVVDQITVSQNVYPSLWMYSGGPLLQAMSTFPDYELRIDGMAFSGFINGGVDFESGSSTLSGNYAQTLDVGVSVLTRDPSLQLIIEGHTDDRGSDVSNQALSQRRAEAVRDYFIANGIDASRLTAVGVGEAEPVVSNATEEGRARNRRIQYVLSTST